MDGLLLPLRIVKGKFARTSDTSDSVSAFLQFLITSAKYSCVSDPEFGFILNNLRFENVGEGEVLNNRKISGTSADPETFAYDLKSAINAYEKRLTAVRVTMTYARPEKLIHIAVKGKLVDNDADFQYVTDIKVWN